MIILVSWARPFFLTGTKDVLNSLSECKRKSGLAHKTTTSHFTVKMQVSHYILTFFNLKGHNFIILENFQNLFNIKVCAVLTKFPKIRI